jgi:hypothetical protein
MELDAIGWPELPHVGSKIEFRGGGVVPSTSGVCTVVRANRACNAAGRPASRVTLKDALGEIRDVSLNQLRRRAELAEDDAT